MKTETFLDGVYTISNDAYHGSNGISRSQLMLLDKSPYHFWYETLSGLKEPTVQTPAMIIGSAFHTLLLEPNKFDNEYAVLPQINRRSAAGKEEYAAFVSENEGKIILTDEQFEKVTKMVMLIKEHDIVTTLLDDALFEQSIYWTDPETDLQFKCRPDIWSTKMIVDVKTTADASPRAFQYSALKYGYYLQAGMMFEACKAIGQPFDMFVVLACEKEAPYTPAVFTLTDEALQFGIDQFTCYKRRLKKCLDNDKWDGYPLYELGVPAFATNPLETDNE